MGKWDDRLNYKNKKKLKKKNVFNSAKNFLTNLTRYIARFSKRSVTSLHKIFLLIYIHIPVSCTSHKQHERAHLTLCKRFYTLARHGLRKKKKETGVF